MLDLSRIAKRRETWAATQITKKALGLCF